MGDQSFFAELRRRKIIQVAAIYGAVAWGVTEVVVTVVEQLFLPQWVSTLAVIFFVVGFPVAMFLAWTFDITSEGIHRTTVTSRRGAASIVASVILVIAGTTGLFFLIKPSLQVREMASAPMAVPVQPNSVAVLPFASGGVNPEEAYLVEGLGDELRDQLARVSGLRIAARTSSIAAIEQGLDALGISSRLGVANFVEGNVRRRGNVLRVSVQLIDGASGLAIWSKTFERGPRELLSVQQEIAEAVVSNVLPESKVVLAEPATRDPTANELMLLARHYEQQVRERDDVDQDTLLEAVHLYRSAAKADPESALANSRLAGALLYLGDLHAAEAPINRALTLNPNLSEVQITLGELRWAQGLTEQAHTAWARAVELDPNNSEALSRYAFSQWGEIEMDGVADLYRRALALDPLNLERNGELGVFLATENYYEETYKLVGTIEELFDTAAAYRVSAELLDFLGEVDRSIAWTIRARDMEPDNPSHVEKLAEYYADIGDAATALRLDPTGIGILFKLRRYEEMIDRAEFAMIDEPDSIRIRSLLAIAYNATGRYESAIHVLRATGVLDSVFNGFRTTAETDAYLALENALYMFGQVEMARELARLMVHEVGYTPGNDWILTVSKACELAILGEDDQARDAMRQARQGPHLAWDPILKDAPCFERFSDDPDYQAMVRYFDDRRTMLRERLPATLAEFGAEL